MRSRAIITVLLAMLLGIRFADAALSKPAAKPRSEKLPQFLANEWPLLHLCFTYETFSGPRGEDRSLLNSRIRFTHRPKTMRGLLALLKQSFPADEFFVSKIFPNVLHVVASKPLGLTDYALDKKISFAFSGEWQGLAKALHRVIPDVAKKMLQSEEAPGGIVAVYPDVTIKLRNVTVRRVLTDIAMRCKGNLLLWVTTTRAVASQAEQAKHAKYITFIHNQ